MKTKLTIILLCALTSVASATTVQSGHATFTGDFTLNHLFNFNDPSAQPFGTLIATDADGLFGQYVQPGAMLEMNTTSLWSLYGNVNNPVITWQSGGYTLTTDLDLITGADFAGRGCLGG